VRSDNATVTENYFAERGVVIDSNVSTVAASPPDDQRRDDSGRVRP
jgi:hypothetical protein